jgi:hypothetical protein
LQNRRLKLAAGLLLILGMVKNAGFVHWAPFLFAPLFIPLCEALFRPIILRLRVAESESTNLKW